MTGSQMPPDPWKQSFVLYDQSGTKFHVSIHALDNYRLYLGTLAISYGTQLGASLLLLVALLLLTKADKRKSLIFIINALCLLTNTIRSILSCCSLTGSIWNPYSQMSGDFSRVTSNDLNTSVATNVMTLLLGTFITISLGLQVWIVCVNISRLRRLIIMFVTCTVGCIALGVKFAAVIFAIKQTLNLENIGPYNKFLSISYIVQGVSIWLFSLVFTCKLGYAVVQRRRLKMTQFGPMQILFIMGCQTMLIPALFTVLQFYRFRGFPILGTQVLTVVCIFLPLSAIWAGIINESKVAGSDPDALKRLVQGQYHQFSLSTAIDGKSSLSDKSQRTSTGTFWKGKGAEITATGTSRQNVDDINPDGIHIAQDFYISREDAANKV